MYYDESVVTSGVLMKHVCSRGETETCVFVPTEEISDRSLEQRINTKFCLKFMKRERNSADVNTG